jgi:hypothetical protein
MSGDDDVKWQPCGQITLCPREWPQLPEVPKGPGIYRLTFADGSVYIGESANLRRRLYEYRRPTKGNECEHQIHIKLLEQRPRAPTVEVFDGGDVSTKAARCKLEQAAIQTAREAGTHLFNEDGQPKIVQLNRRIAYLENVLSDLRRELAAAQAAQRKRMSGLEC